jgi:uncharacterized protein (TIGR03067 family)
MQSALLLTASLLLVAADKPPSDKDEFQGTWVLDQRSRKEGKPLPAELRKALQIRFTGDKIIFKNGDDTHEGTVAIQPDRKPKAITITHRDGKTRASKGLYFFSRGLLVLYFAAPGQDRPKEVPKDGGKGEFLVLERVKP